MLQRCLRLNPGEPKIWIELFRLELLHTARIRARNAVLGIDAVDANDDNNDDNNKNNNNNGDDDDNDVNRASATTATDVGSKKRTRGVYDSDSDASRDDDNDGTRKKQNKNCVSFANCI